MTRSNLAIRLEGVIKRFGAITAVDGLDLEVAYGTCVGLLGPNGAGKSTTLKALTAQVIADAGEIEILGYRLPAESKQARAEMGVVPQLDNLDTSLTVIQNLLVFTYLYRVPGSERQAAIDRALAIANLTDRADSKVDELSGGMRRRLLIARALLHQPRLVLRILTPARVPLRRIATKARRLFDLDADPMRIAADLGSSGILSRLVKARPGLRVPACAEMHDPHGWAGARLTLLEYLAFRVEGVPDEYRGGELHLVPAEVGKRVLADVNHRHPGHERERKRAVHERAPKFGLRCERVVEVHRIGVHGQIGEPDVVGVDHRAPVRMLVDIPDVEVFEVPALLRRAHALTFPCDASG